MTIDTPTETKAIKVLCIEDDSGIAYLIKKRLSSDDFSTDLAFSLTEAKEKLKQQSYDVILIDNYLPDGEGVNFLKKIIEDNPFANCIIITAMGSEAIASLAFLYGANNYIVKDVDGNFLEVLPSVLHQALEKAELKRENAQRTKDLEKALLDLKEVIGVQENLIALISHEIKTPISSIVQTTDVLLYNEQLQWDPKIKQGFQTIQDAVNYLNALIKNVTSFQQLNKGNLSINVSKFIVKEVLEQALNVVRPLLVKKDIQLRVNELEFGSLEMEGDREKITQIIINFLVNALKYTKQGSISLIASVEKGDLLVEVTDTGIGIASNLLEKIFLPYMRVMDTKTTAKGSGLGLTICQKFAELHGGKIVVKSEEGRGSSFTVILPLASRL